MIGNEFSFKLCTVEHFALISENYIGIYLIFARELNDRNEIVVQTAKQTLLNA